MHGLATEPADRDATEAALTAIYARIRRRAPRFAWVDSPQQAIPLLTGLPTLRQLYLAVRHPTARERPTLASELLGLTARLRSTLSAGVVHHDPELTPVHQGKSKQQWPDAPLPTLVRNGAPPGVVLHQIIRGSLHRSLMRGFFLPVRAALDGSGEIPVCWYGQQEASWIGYYDALRRLDLACYPADGQAQLADWAVLARSCGWWWPSDDVCVVVERPKIVQVEPAPADWHGEVRLAARGVRFRDGWQPDLVVS